MRTLHAWARSAAILTIAAGAVVAHSTPALSAPDPIDNGSRASVVSAYQTWLAPTLDVPVGWTGSVADCRAGTTSDADRTATLSAVNYMRAMADLAPVVLDPVLSAKSQAAALIMTANEFLSHDPPKSATCWTVAGHEAASNGNLSIGFGYDTGSGQDPLAASTGPRAIVSYMTDPGPGNEIVGHRRWILFQQLKRIGSGDTSTANSLYVIDGYRAPAGTTWIPWPTAGFFPRELEPEGRWSVSYPGADFRKARVKVTTPDGPVSVRKAKVANGYADNTLSWDMTLPPGYTASTADYPVTVTVSGIRMPGGKKATRTWTTTLVRAAP